MREFKRIAVLFVAVLFCAAALFANPAAVFAAPGEKTIMVFAAASMTESLNKIAGLYKEAAPDVKLVFNFDSSGTLKTQIEQGADCDIFISAGQKQMNEIEEKFVMPTTRFNIVANRVVMIVPKGRNAKKINDFKDVVTDKVSLVALGNADVPVGQYSQEVYKFLGLWDKLNEMKRISFASNVKEVLTQVAAGAVDCGVVYSTDAASSKEVQIVADAPKGSHKPVVYPAAILKNTKDLKASMAFVKYLKGDAARKVLTDIGFSIPEK